MNNLTSILLMAPPEEGGGGFATFIPLLLIIVVFYLFFIRPQLKKQKDARKYRESLKKGDKIITIGGIHGKISDVQEKTFTIEITPDVRIRVEKSAVAMDAATDQLQEKK
ncbi:MAG: preprotein translocase subunit YajC [Bacteroidota bacterium]